METRNNRRESYISRNEYKKIINEKKIKANINGRIYIIFGRNAK